MPGLLIEDLPEELHRKLKERAAWNRRSMAREALALLEQALATADMKRVQPPEPYTGRFLIDDNWINEAKRDGRT